MSANVNYSLLSIKGTIKSLVKFGSDILILYLIILHARENPANPVKKLCSFSTPPHTNKSLITTPLTVTSFSICIFKHGSPLFVSLYQCFSVNKIFGGQSGIGTGFSPSTGVFPYQYRPTNCSIPIFI